MPKSGANRAEGEPRLGGGVRSPPALMDAARFSLARHLERHYELIRGEVDRLAMEDLYLWGDSDACTKPWYCSPLVRQPPACLLDIDWTRQRELLPATLALLQARPEVDVAGLSYLTPGAHIHSHVDTMEPGTMRMLFPVQVPRESGIRIGGELLRWKEGRAQVFESRVDHEAANLGSKSRIVIFITFRLTAEERRYAEERIAGVDEKWFVNAAGAGLYGPRELASGKCYSRDLPGPGGAHWDGAAGEPRGAVGSP